MNRTNGSASTYAGPILTVEAMKVAMAQLKALPPIDLTPIVLTYREARELAAQATGAAPGELEKFQTLLGIPLRLVTEGDALARMFTLRERVERKHWMLRQPREWPKAIEGEWRPSRDA